MRFYRLCTAVVILLTVGCQTVGTADAPFRFYEGPARTKAEVAILRSKGEPLRLRSINGKPGPNQGLGANKELGEGYYGSDWDVSCVIELLPDTYRLSVEYHAVSPLNPQASLLYSDTKTVEFTAQAGHTYILDLRWSGQQRNASWQPIVSDETEAEQPKR